PRIMSKWHGPPISRPTHAAKWSFSDEGRTTESDPAVRVSAAGPHDYRYAARVRSARRRHAGDVAPQREAHGCVVDVAARRPGARTRFGRGRRPVADQQRVSDR